MIVPIPKHVRVDRDILLLQGSVAFVELAVCYLLRVDRDILLLQGSVAFVELAVCQLLRHTALDAVVLNAHDLVQHAAW